MRTPPRFSRRSQRGYVLPFALVLAGLFAVVVVVAIKGVVTRQGGTERGEVTSRVASNSGAALTRLRQTLRQNAEQLVSPRLTGTVNMEGREAGSLILRPADGGSDGPESAPLPLPGFSSDPPPNVLTLADNDDPFRGAPALVLPLQVTGRVTPYESTALAAGGTNAAPQNVDAIMDYRMIPLTAFSWFSEGSLELDLANPGRVYARRDIVVRQPSAPTNTVVTGGIVRIAGGATLTVSDQQGSQTLTENDSTSTMQWVANQAAQGSRRIATGREIPTALALVGTSGTAFAAEGSPETAAFRYASASWIKLQVTTARDFVWSEAATTDVTAAVSLRDTPRNAQKITIAVDLAAFTRARGGEKVSMHITCEASGAIVLLVGGNDLRSDVSISTPLPVYVEGAFNRNARAATIISGAGAPIPVIEDF